MRSAHFFEFEQGLFGGLGGSERTLAGHAHVGVRNGDDARPQRNLLSAQAAQIAAAIEGFVMVLHRFP